MLDTFTVRTSVIEEITCANLLFEGYGNLPPGGFQIEEGQVGKKVPGTTLVKIERGQTPSHFKEEEETGRERKKGGERGKGEGSGKEAEGKG